MDKVIRLTFYTSFSRKFIRDEKLSEFKDDLKKYNNGFPHGIKKIIKTKRFQIKAVKFRPDIIRFIENPSEFLQLAAIEKSWGSAIKYIKNPSEQICLEAIGYSTACISYIKNPSFEIQLRAVNQEGWAIQYIKNPSEEIQLAAIQTSITAIEFIKNPTFSAKRLSIERKLAARGKLNPEDVIFLRSR